MPLPGFAEATPGRRAHYEPFSAAGLYEAGSIRSISNLLAGRNEAEGQPVISKPEAGLVYLASNCLRMSSMRWRTSGSGSLTRFSSRGTTALPI